MTALMARGHTWVTAEIACEYGPADVGGSRPASHRTVFGGGPLL